MVSVRSQQNGGAGRRRASRRRRQRSTSGGETPLVSRPKERCPSRRLVGGVPRRRSGESYVTWCSGAKGSDNRQPTTDNLTADVSRRNTSSARTPPPV